jgi:hypothetical protein
MVIDHPDCSSISKQLLLQHLHTITIEPTHAISNMGSRFIFIMDRANVDNRRLSKKPLPINLPNGNKVQSMHRCVVMIPGLPRILMGHIVPHSEIASIIGIQPLCKAGCRVIFDYMKCNVINDGNIIL